MKIGDFIQNKLMKHVVRFTNSKPIQAISRGMVRLTPLTIVGSIFLIIWNFPIPAVKEWLISTGYRDYFLKANAATVGILALVSVAAIAYEYAKLEEIEPLGAGFAALASFFLICPNTMLSGETVVSNAFNLTWAGSQGMIGAILVGLFTGWFYCFLIKHNVKFKMPKEIPANIADNFSAMIPTALCVVVATIVFTVFDKLSTTAMDWVYHVLQLPLQGVSNSLAAVVVCALVISFFWWFGIHGGTIAIALFGAIEQANLVHNAELLAAGIKLNAQNGAFIFTKTFEFNFIILSGAGVSFGILFYMLFFAKSKTYKTLGKMSAVPVMFNVNEPILFGTPVIYNPVLLIPFVLIPVICAALSYLAIQVGIVPYPNGAMAPSLTPPILAGFFNGGWRWAVMQTVCLVISAAGYFPFMKKADRLQCEKEEQMAAEEGTEAI